MAAKYHYCWFLLFYMCFTLIYNCRFRRQHEQLRQVIVRVLRPVAPAKANSPSTEDKDKATEMGLDAADANAIEVQCIVIFYLNLWCKIRFLVYIYIYIY